MARSVSGVILAGGANKRFGGLIKANIEIEGKTILSGIIEKISDYVEEIIVVTNSPQEFNHYRGITLVGDVFANAGPLGGIHAGMNSSAKEAVFVLAGDMPLLNTTIIDKQIKLWKNSHCDILVPRVGINFEPLHAIYSKSVFNLLTEYLSGENNHAVRNFYNIAGADYFDLEDTEDIRRAFTNINYPADLEKI
jgi:molybdenum cofactor guanylyltransferase